MVYQHELNRFRVHYNILFHWTFKCVMWMPWRSYAGTVTYLLCFPHIRSFWYRPTGWPKK